MSPARREEILPATATRPEVVVVRSARRTKTVSARMEDGGRVRLLVPAATSRAEVAEYLEKLLPPIMRQQEQRRAQKKKFASDDFLLARARDVQKNFLPELARLPDSIRWVTNQKSRWGSATPSQGRVRISHVLQGVPDYVLDFVLHHELCHFLEANHNRRFKALESRYPRKAEAEAFLAGITFAHRGS